MSSDKDRDTQVYMAKLSEQAERYEEMVECIKKVAKLDVELTVEERNLLSVGYKNVIGARRASWRIMSSIEQKEESKGNEQNVKLIKGYRQKVEDELSNICNDILSIIDKNLIPSSASGEATVFYYKMKGDYYRYLAEFKTDQEKKECSENSMKGYEACLFLLIQDMAASETANKELPSTHPIRLGLALNFSVFYYEIMNSPERACHLAKQAFDEAIAELDTLSEESYKDSTLIMQLLRDNLTLWTSDLPEDGGDDSNVKGEESKSESKPAETTEDENGEWKDTEDEVQGIISRYFDDIFSTRTTGESMSDRIKFARISEEQGNELVLPVTEEEVKEAVFAMHPNKSPGIDGFNPTFFQTYWNIVGADVISFCQRFFITGDLPEDVNRTLVCLIPKVKQPKRMAELRPISLCNVMMRIISKIMANRLKPCLHSIVSEKQSAFIEGRLLTDNALIAFEINSYIKRKTQGREGVAGLKVDVSKATVAYSFVRDGNVFGNVKPQRGLRQGDPISPYLYILCAEGLSGIIRKYEETGLLHGYGEAREIPGDAHVCGEKQDRGVRFFERVQAKLQGWGNKDLSKQGKVTLLKTATRVIPSFWMNLFLIPVNMCEELEQKMNAFLWGRGSTGKGVKWVAWKKLCRPKECGGLGVRDLRNFNLAMLAKQGWRFLNETNPLVSAFMKAKYYPQTDLLNAEAGANASYIWRSIMASLRAVKAGTRRKIGNGIDTNVWEMPWIPRLEDEYLTSAMQNYLGHITVNNLMVTGEKRWDLAVIKDIIDSRDVEEIKHIPLLLSDTRDSWFWVLDEKGDFTVKSCYRWLQGEIVDEDKSFWKRLCMDDYRSANLCSGLRAGYNN
ncbi:hypothetical protein AgCh_019659 [Apium graveolens]